MPAGARRRLPCKTDLVSRDQRSPFTPKSAGTRENCPAIEPSEGVLVRALHLIAHRMLDIFEGAGVLIYPLALFDHAVISANAFMFQCKDAGPARRPWWTHNSVPAQAGTPGARPYREYSRAGTRRPGGGEGVCPLEVTTAWNAGFVPTSSTPPHR